MSILKRKNITIIEIGKKVISDEIENGNNFLVRSYKLTRAILK